MPAPWLQSIQQAVNTAAPRSSKIIETVVEVGRPRELKMLSMMTSDTITAK